MTIDIRLVNEQVSPQISLKKNLSNSFYIFFLLCEFWKSIRLHVLIISSMFAKFQED